MFQPVRYENKMTSVDVYRVFDTMSGIWCFTTFNLNLEMDAMYAIHTTLYFIDHCIFNQIYKIVLVNKTYLFLEIFLGPMMIAKYPIKHI